MNIHTAIISELKNGSYNAFNKLYDMYADLLYGFVFDLTKSPVDTKDIVQDVFLKVWNNRESLPTDIHFKAYIYKIARNQIIDSFRRQMQLMIYDTYLCTDHISQQIENNVEKDIHFKELNQQLQEAKKRLTARQQIIFEMSREQGMPVSQIAGELGISEQTVKNQLTIALKRLREELSRYTFFLFFL